MDETKIETALIFLNNGDFPNAHALIRGMDTEESAHLFNQVSLETEMNYEAWESQHREALPADSQIDEITQNI
jgi:hypothetical protein